MKITDAQKRALKWLDQAGGSGVIDRYGRVLAAGEARGQTDAKTWLRLVSHQLVAGANGRMAITEAGRAIVRGMK